MALPKYLHDCYLKEMDTKVVSVKDSKYVVLEDTIFYPQSGGQPYDTGVIKKGEEEYPVIFVGSFGGNISHEVSKEGLQEGDDVHIVIDWDRRYKHMRMHTTAHVLCAIIEKKEPGVKITGNQLGFEKSRIDFSLENFDREKISAYAEDANELVQKEVPVKSTIVKREAIPEDSQLFRLAAGFPEDVKEIRVVEIAGWDQQACGGTHVRNLKEIGNIVITKTENKGKNNRRIYYSIE